MASVIWRELSFHVPWGVISGKECGPNDGKPFLGLHGRLDNANTFDKLAPFLPQDIHFVAIDFPGHGRSSHRPPGAKYDYFEWVTDVKRVVNQLQWKEFSIIGHSMGGGVGSFYTGTFPAEIRHLVVIEIGFPAFEYHHPADILAWYVRRSTSKKEIKAATYPDLEAMAEKVVNASVFEVPLSKESARILVQRGSIPTPGGDAVQFSHDKRIKDESPYIISLQTAGAILERITCKVLYVRARQQMIPDDRHEARVQARLQLVRNAEKFIVKRLPGGHHIHMDNPEMVAKEIADFLSPLNNSSSVGSVSKL